MADEKLPQFAEDEDLARAKAFWNENGKPIMAGIVIGLGAIFGYNYWNSYQQSQGEQASELFELTRGPGDGARSAASELKESFPGTSYATLAALSLAASHVESGDLETATNELRWARENAPDEGLKHIATLRLASVLIANDNAEDALAILSPADMGEFESRYHELRGDTYMQRNQEGDAELARESYQQSLDSSGENDTFNGIVQLKLDNVR